MSRYVTSIVAMLGLAFGVFMLVVAGAPSPAKAFVPNERYILENIARDTKSADAATRARARAVLTRSARTAYLRPVAGTGTPITPVLMRAGLAGAAAGIWIHNGITIYNISQCGEAETCPPPLRIDGEFRVAEETAEAAGAGGTIVRTKAWDQLKAEVMITRVDYRPAQKQTEVWFVRKTAPDYTEPWRTNGSMGIASPGSQSGGFATFSLENGNPSPWLYGAGSGSGTAQFYGLDFNNSEPVQRKFFGPKFQFGQPMTWDSPVFDMGGVSTARVAPDYTPPPGDFIPSADQNKKLLESIQGDAEFDPAWAEHPWDKKSKPWRQLEPPSTDDGDEDIFGPIRRKWDDDAGEYTEFEDGTRRYFKYGDTDRVYRNFVAGDLREIWRWYGPPGRWYYMHTSDDDVRPGIVPCGVEGDVLSTINYQNGVTRYTIYPAGTTSAQFKDTQPICDSWKDASGNEIARPDPAEYPDPPLQFLANPKWGPPPA